MRGYAGIAIVCIMAVTCFSCVFAFAVDMRSIHILAWYTKRTEDTSLDVTCLICLRYIAKCLNAKMFGRITESEPYIKLTSRDVRRCCFTSVTGNYEIIIQMLHVYIIYYYIVHNIYICIYNISKDSVNRGGLGKCFVEKAKNAGHSGLNLMLVCCLG